MQLLLSYWNPIKHLNQNLEAKVWVVTVKNVINSIFSADLHLLLGPDPCLPLDLDPHPSLDLDSRLQLHPDPQR